MDNNGEKIKKNTDKKNTEWFKSYFKGRSEVEFGGNLCRKENKTIWGKRNILIQCSLKFVGTNFFSLACS